MKPAIFGALMAIAVVNASDARALSYILIDSQGNTKYLTQPPKDMTYPPDGVRMPVYDKSVDPRQRGKLLTQQEESARMKADMLIIYEKSASPSENALR